MHKVTILLLRGCYLIATGFLLLSILLLVSMPKDTLSLGHTLLTVREMCSTGAVVLLLSVIGSAALHDRFGSRA